MKWKNQRVVVTGAGGFIGSHLAERLVQEGATVRALVRYNSRGHRGWLESSSASNSMEILSGDIRDAAFVDRLTEKAEVVFHLAALIGIPYSYEAPESYVETNIVGTLNVLQSARRHGVGRVLVTSTSEVYGTARYVPIDEKHPLQGQSPYSASKIGADKMAESFACSFGLPVVVVRPFNTFGPRQSARAVIPTIITQLLKGKTLSLGNVHPTRDLSYVADTVEGFLLAGERKTALGETLNLGRGEEISIGDLARRIAARLGISLSLQEDQRRLRPGASEVERLLANADKARQSLGWAPKVSLDEGLDLTIAWLRENAALYRENEYTV